MRRPTLAAIVATACVVQSVLVFAGPGVAGAAESGFQALAAPQRVLDTRSTGVTADGAHQAAGAVAGETWYRLPLAGRVGLPGAIDAVVLNVTVTEPSAPGFVIVYPCRETPPTASNVNYTPGQTVPNAVITAVDDSGAVCLFTKATTHLVVDVSGWFPQGAYSALDQPARLYESRPGRPTVDQQQAGEGMRPAESVTRVKVHGRAGLATPPSVVLNITASEAQGPGFMTVFPCGVDRPNASNLNYLAAQTVPNLVVAKVGADGEVCVFTKAAAHLVVDVAGAFAGATFAPLGSPQRLVDSRPDGATADGQFQGFGTQPSRGSLQLDVRRAGIPAEASAVVLNVTAVAPRAAGYLTIHPRGSGRPNASNVNHAPAQTIANAVVARIGRDGQICMFNLPPTDVLVDVTGYLTGPPPPTTGDPCPATTPTEGGVVNTLVRRPAMHTAIGHDRVAVLICDAPDLTPSNFPTLDAGAVAAWANEQVAPWFASASRGTYTVGFEPIGRVTLGSWGACINDAPSMTESPYTNVLVVTEEAFGGGQASPGWIYPNVNPTVLDGRPPAESNRFAWVGGGAAFEDPSVFVHEIGHTLHWPHSYIYVEGDLLTEYNNPADLMSGQFEAPLHTMGFNRLTAGWIADQQIAIHRSGRANYAVDAQGGDGVQFVALPDPGDPLQSMTVEAIAAAGGVAVHLVDQTGDGFHTGVSTERRHAQAAGNPGTTGHVVTPGNTLTAHGVTISVHAAAGGGYSIMVSGTYHAPGPLPRVPGFNFTQADNDGADGGPVLHVN